MGNALRYIVRGKSNRIKIRSLTKEKIREIFLSKKYGEMKEWPDGFFDQAEIDLRTLLMRKLHAKS